MRNKKTRFPRLTVLWIIMFLVIGIGAVRLFGLNDTGTFFHAGEERQYIAVIGKSDISAFWISVSSGARAAAAEYNLDMTFEAPSSEEDFEAQNEMIRSAIRNHASAIVFSAIDYNGNAEAINEAIDARIPVIVIDSDVNSPRVSCRIMTDNYLAGRMAGEQAARNNDGNLVVGIVNYDVNGRSPLR